MEHVGQFIRLGRMEREWTATQLAQKLGVSKSLLSQFETGRDTPKPKLIVQIARLLRLNEAMLREQATKDKVRRYEGYVRLRYGMVVHQKEMKGILR